MFVLAKGKNKTENPQPNCCGGGGKTGYRSKSTPLSRPPCFFPPFLGFVVWMEKHRPSATGQLHKPKPQFTKQETGSEIRFRPWIRKSREKATTTWGPTNHTLHFLAASWFYTGHGKNSHKIEQKSAYIRSALQGLKLCYQDTKA